MEDVPPPLPDLVSPQGLTQAAPLRRSAACVMCQNNQEVKMSDDSKFNKWRDRKFRLLLYPEDPTHAEAIKRLKADGYHYVAILHDKDVKDAEDPADVEFDGAAGELKKAHWHVVMKFLNPVWNTAIAKKLGIAVNYIRDCKDLDGAIVYLVHANDSEKHQYDAEEAFGTMKTRLFSLLRDDDESTRALNIYEIIRSSPGFVTYTEVFEKACKSGLYGDFRRLGTGVSNLIREHNWEVELELMNKEERKAAAAQRFSNFMERSADVDFPTYIKIMDKNGLLPGSEHVKSF